MRRFILLIHLLILASLGCSLTNGIGPNPTLEPNPLDVSVSLDESLAVTALIPVEGGTLNATGADGTTFTLTIPPDALLGEADIMMTPVIDVEDLPFSNGLVAAVHLEPEGLRLFAPATLTIETSGKLNTEEVSGFGYYMEGEDFHLQPVGLTGSILTFEVMHFSGRGAGWSTVADRNAQRSRVPRRAEAQAAQELSFRDANTRAALDNWYTNGVRPKIDAAQSNVAVFDSATADFLSWLKQVQTEGLMESYRDQISRALEGLAAATERALEGASRACAEGGGSTEVMEAARLLKLADRLSAALSLYNPELAAFFDDDLRDMQGQIDDCMNFTLSFSSSIDINGDAILDVSADVPVRWEVGKGLTGEAPSTETITIFLDCTWSASAAPGTFQVTGASFGFRNLYETSGESGPSSPPKLTLRYDPGTPTEAVSVTCPIVGTYPLNWAGAWRHFFESFHGGTGGFEVDLEPGSGEVFAEASFRNTGSTEDGYPVHETTFIELWHTPKK